MPEVAAFSDLHPQSNPADFLEKPRVVHVLVIDDELPLARSTKRLLEAYSGCDPGVRFAVTIANGPEEAIQKIQDGLAPEAIFCDISMPGMTGQDFYEWLRKNHPDWEERIRFVSAGSGGSTALQGFMEGMGERVIEKPFSAEKIRSAIRSVLGLAIPDPPDPADAIMPSRAF